jgi:hypothetical protein
MLLPRADGFVERPITVAHYRFLHARDWLDEWQRAHGPAKSTTIEGAPELAVPAAVDTGVRARDVLAPLDPVRKLFDRPPVSRVIPPRVPDALARATGRAKRAGRDRTPILDALAIPAPAGRGLESTPLGSRPGGAFLDPVAAQAGGLLRLAHGSDEDNVVATWRGTLQPIFIPAGQILTGPVDRVVARPVWLPPGRGNREQRTVIPCHVVENLPDASPLEPPQLSPWVAGPTIRSLLAAGASAAEVKQAARQQVAAHNRIYQGVPRALDFGAWSLLAVYGGKAGSANLERARQTPWGSHAGFVALDARGRLVGVEIVHLTGEHRDLLLSRLWHGYVVEASLRHLGASPDAVAAPGEGLEETMRIVARADTGLRTPEGFRPVGGTRVSSLEIPAIGLALHVLDVHGKPKVVSALSAADR